MDRRLLSRVLIGAVGAELLHRKLQRSRIPLLRLALGVAQIVQRLAMSFGRSLLGVLARFGLFSLGVELAAHRADFSLDFMLRRSFNHWLIENHVATSRALQELPHQNAKPEKKAEE